MALQLGMGIIMGHMVLMDQLLVILTTTHQNTKISTQWEPHIRVIQARHHRCGTFILLRRPPSLKMTHSEALRDPSLPNQNRSWTQVNWPKNTIMSDHHHPRWKQNTRRGALLGLLIALEKQEREETIQSLSVVKSTWAWYIQYTSSSRLSSKRTITISCSSISTSTSNTLSLLGTLSHSIMARVLQLNHSFTNLLRTPAPSSHRSTKINLLSRLKWTLTKRALKAPLRRSRTLLSSSIACQEARKQPSNFFVSQKKNWPNQNIPAPRVRKSNSFPRIKVRLRNLWPVLNRFQKKEIHPSKFLWSI